MATERFIDQMQAYGKWRSEIIVAIEKYQQWLESNAMDSAEVEIRIYELIETLKSDQLTIAFVAEFARGKTELINAIFFSEYDRRLLPSEAGRTTMCPTELFYDTEENQSYIRLLPIETRLDDTSIQEHKKDPINWTSISLDTGSSEKMAEAFLEVIKTKRVPLPVAEKLGLSDYRANKDDNMVEIPMWRHALISFPHPLLKEGLTILDTPGLNALGNEPELTVNMLPNAQAVIFVLAADTGVTKSDLEMWEQNVQPLGGDAKHGRIVVLNKVDTLWDELKTQELIEASIDSQCNAAAKMLNIGRENVFPVSAQKGLLAKIRHDIELLERSNILPLEAILAKDILPQKQKIVRDNILSEIGSMVKGSHSIIASRLKNTQKQLDELSGLSGKNEDVIGHLMKKTREEQNIYHKSVESFQASKKTFIDNQKKLLQILDLNQLDALMAKTRKEMSGSWTTAGIKNGMKDFFEIIATTITSASQQSDDVNMLLQTIYRTFNKQHDLEEVKPRLFSIGKYKRDLDRLYNDAKAYRSSPKLAATEQAFVVKKFFISMVSHARNTFFQAHQEVEAWGKAGMAPLVSRIKEHRNQMEKRLESLRKINESRDTLQSRITELESNSKTLELQLSDLDELLATLTKPLEQFVDKKAASQVA